MRWLLGLLMLLGTAPPAGATDLKLLITVEQPAITDPWPAQVTLHLHNSGAQTLLLYTPVRDASVVSGAVNPFITEQPGPGSTSGGSALEVHLIPLRSSSSDETAEGRVLEVAGFPHPKLVTLQPGGDFEEKTAVRLLPATSDPNNAKPVWGTYKLSVTYSASYSNGDDLNRILGGGIWQGKVESNSIQVDLQPPPTGAPGSISGSVLDKEMQPTFGAMVTLSNRQEQVLSQSVTGNDGRFAFTKLPVGFYWVTARRLGSPVDMTVYRHVELNAAAPAGTLQLVMLRPEVYHPEQLLHKPVLIEVSDAQGQPLGNVSLDSTWSSGTVLDNVKARTTDQGMAAMELIPGRNFLSLRRKGCPKQDERLDVAPGSGIDGFKLVFNCSKR
jgi:Carboxypeptidase regulatory-like domain